MWRICISLTHKWPYEFKKPQWPYHGLSGQFFFSKTFYTWTSMTIHGLIDQVFFNLVCETVVWSLTFRVENALKKILKTQSVRVWSLADWVKNLTKKMTRSVRQWYDHWRVKIKLNNFITNVINFAPYTIYIEHSPFKQC